MWDSYETRQHLERACNYALGRAISRARAREEELALDSIKRGIVRKPEHFREQTNATAFKEAFEELVVEIMKLVDQGTIPHDQDGKRFCGELLKNLGAKSNSSSAQTAASRAAAEVEISIQRLALRPALAAAPAQGPQSVIHIHGGTIGAINTGTIRALEVQINALGEHGHAELAKAFQVLSDSIRHQQRFSPTEQQEALEHVTFLAEEAGKPPEQRKPSLARTSAEALVKVMAVSSDALALWELYRPMIVKALGW